MIKVMLLTLGVLTLAVAPLAAQKVPAGWGLRAGFSLNPDQVQAGAHVDLGTIGRRVRIQPNIEIGFGDDVTSYSFNPEFMYLFRTRGDWVPYLGGGLGVTVYSFDPPEPAEDFNDTETGVNLLGGIETNITRGSRLFIEGKVGVGDIPDAKIVIGITFLR